MSRGRTARRKAEATILAPPRYGAHPCDIDSALMSVKDRRSGRVDRMAWKPAFRPYERGGLQADHGDAHVDRRPQARL